MKESGIDVKIVGTDLAAFIKRADLARERGEQRPERFSVGQKVDARVTQFDRKTHKVGVSIKALEVAEEKEAIAQYGTADQARRLAIFSVRRSSSGPATSRKPKPKRPKNRPLFGSLKRRKTRGEPRVFHFNAAKTRPHHCAMRGIDRYNLVTIRHM